jgi:hypothetical protein
MSQSGAYITGGGLPITSVVGGDNINVQTVGTVATVNLDTAISWPATDPNTFKWCHLFSWIWFK